MKSMKTSASKAALLRFKRRSAGGISLRRSTAHTRLRREVIQMYSKKLMDLFKNPHNMGKIEDADAIGKVGNPTCGDVMYIYLKVKDNVIEDIKFETFGCAAAIATSSMVTDLAKGKTLEEAEGITNKTVADELDGLPALKVHCSVLAIEGLREAIKEYRKKHL